MDADCQECLRLKAEHYRCWEEVLACMSRLDGASDTFDCEAWITESEMAGARCDAALWELQMHERWHRIRFTCAA